MRILNACRTRLGSCAHSVSRPHMQHVAAELVLVLLLCTAHINVWLNHLKLAAASAARMRSCGGMGAGWNDCPVMAS